MVNTMADLREEVASRLRNAMHGREIDMMKNSIELPHMLGITPIGKVHDPTNEEMTLLDTQHPFWQDYHKDIRTGKKVKESIETAIRSLREDQTFRMTYPYGEEAEIVYVEVDKLSRQNDKIATTCADCGRTIDGDIELRSQGNGYAFCTIIDCPHCSFSGSFESQMVRR